MGAPGDVAELDAGNSNAPGRQEKPEHPQKTRTPKNIVTPPRSPGDDNGTPPPGLPGVDDTASAGLPGVRGSVSPGLPHGAHGAPPTGLPGGAHGAPSPGLPGGVHGAPPAGLPGVDDTAAAGLGRGALAGALRAALPEIVADAVAAVRREVAEYADPGCRDAVELAAACALGRFVDLLYRPAARHDETPHDEVLAFFRGVGAAEAQEDRAPGVLQNGLNVASRVAVRHFARADVPPVLYAELVSGLFPFLNQLMVAAAQGRAEASRDPARLRRRHRRALLDALLAAPAAEPARLRGLAHEAGWPLPRRAAAVVLDPRDAQRGTAEWGTVPPEVLDGRYRDEPCLIVPVPAHRPALERLLHGRRAAVGPAVEVSALARSLTWARQALDLAADGVVPDEGPIMAADHAPTIVVLRHREIVEHAARRRLRPLLKVRPNRRDQYARTLQAVLECGFNASAAAGRLDVHPQTVRLRLRRLDELFGAQIHDPALHVELLMALRLWRATARRGAQPDWFQTCQHATPTEGNP